MEFYAQNNDGDPFIMVDNDYSLVLDNYRKTIRYTSWRKWASRDIENINKKGHDSLTGECA